MKNVLLIRHGATAGNLARRYIGRTDEPLCEAGVKQVAALREKRFAAESVFVSPMLRARETAELLFPDRAHIVMDGLRETDFGIFEGKTAEELAGCPDYQVWVDGWCRGAIPGGESKDEAADRAAAAFLQAMDAAGNGCAAFVTHGGVIMALVERFGAEKADFYDYHVKNGGYLCCRWDGEHLFVAEKG